LFKNRGLILQMIREAIAEKNKPAAVPLRPKTEEVTSNRRNE
jgi:hypothetical protein